MKQVVTTVTAAIFALGLVSAGLAQTTQTPAKPEVKKETGAVATPAASKEAGKPAVTKPGAVQTEAAKSGKKSATKEAGKPLTKKEAKKQAKKAKAAKKSSAPVEKSQPEKK
jgi:hypothetical protein